MEDVKEKSEFGKGLTYCLGLFLCHSERDIDKREPTFGSAQRDVEMWFYGASDHLYELEIPDFYPSLCGIVSAHSVICA